MASGREIVGERPLQKVLDGIYLGGLLAASPILAWKLGADARYRDRISERFGNVPVRSTDGPCLWVHCASVGEVLGVMPLIRAWKADHPEWWVTMSTLTATGQEIAGKQSEVDQVVLFPVDLSFSVRRAFDRIRPDAVLLMELEIWPNFLLEASHRGIPVSIVNGRVEESALAGYRKGGATLQRAFSSITSVGAQTPEYARRFGELGVPMARVDVTGNMKFDSVHDGLDTTKVAELKEELAITDDQWVWVCGSTSEPEEEHIRNAWEALKSTVPGLRLIVVPRHPERGDEVHKIFAGSQNPCYKRTSLPAELSGQETIIVDTIGELKALYALATVVFVGGSFGSRGGQNMLEPAALGKPVLFGPNTRSFRDAAARLLDAGGAHRVKSPEDLAPSIQWLADHADKLETIGLAGRDAVLAERGATERNKAKLEKILNLQEQ
jgi:3-deoxy-D-manno-octulosonic-acid transferase